MPNTDTNQHAAEAAETTANNATERLFKEYNAVGGKDSPERTVKAALAKGDKAVKAMLGAILAIDGHSEHVDVEKLQQIDILSTSKAKNTEDIKSILLSTKYTGANIDIHVWQSTELRKSAGISSPTKKDSGKQLLFNIASTSCIDVSNAIMNAASTAKMKMSDLVEEAFKSLPEAKYKEIHKSGTGDKVKEKVKLIAGKLSSKGAKGHDKLAQKNKKLDNQKGLYGIKDID